MKRSAKIIRDLTGVELAGRQIGPFQAGKEVELEPWEAGVLERHGFIEAGFTTTELRKLILAEERSPGLQLLPQDFYSMLVQLAKNLRKAGKHDEAKKFKEVATTLIDIRLQKLMQLATSPVGTEKFPFEEQFLINRLISFLEDWNRRLEISLEGSAKEEADNERKFWEFV